MEKVLIIYEFVCNKTAFYLVPKEEALPFWDKMEKCVGKFINCNNSEDVDESLDWLHEQIDKGPWKKYEVDGKTIANSDQIISRVIHSGFVV